MNDREIRVHRTHCCIIHGCKYGELDCPVVNEEVEQAYPCEDCGCEGITMDDIQKVINKRKGNTMRKIILEMPVDNIDINNVNDYDLIIGKEEDKISGMIIFIENLGWIFKISSKTGCSGYHATLKECLKSCMDLGYEFYVV